MNKRGLSHLEFMLSFLIFVIFIAILFIVLNPFSTKNKISSIDGAEEAIKERLKTNLTIISFIPDSASSCFSVEKPVENEENVIVRTKNNRINAEANGIIYIDGESTNFYKILFSEDFEENQAEQCELKQGTFGVPITYNMYSYKKLQEFNETYYKNYAGIRQDLKLREDFNLKISVSGEEFIMQKNVPEGLSIEGREKPIQILMENGEILQAKLNLIIY